MTRYPRAPLSPSVSPPDGENNLLQTGHSCPLHNSGGLFMQRNSLGHWECLLCTLTEEERFRYEQRCSALAAASEDKPYPPPQPPYTEADIIDIHFSELDWESFGRPRSLPPVPVPELGASQTAPQPQPRLLSQEPTLAHMHDNREASDAQLERPISLSAHATTPDMTEWPEHPHDRDLDAVLEEQAVPGATRARGPSPRACMWESDSGDDDVMPDAFAKEATSWVSPKLRGATLYMRERK